MIKKVTFEFDLVDVSELSESYRHLVASVVGAKERAYAPYSHFSVGAGVLLRDGAVITATNQESEVFPSGICAERALLFNAQSNYMDIGIEAMAVTASPCGACRQVMLDTERRGGSDIKVLILMDNNRVAVIDSVRCLLPLAFSLK